MDYSDNGRSSAYADDTSIALYDMSLSTSGKNLKNLMGREVTYSNWESILPRNVTVSNGVVSLTGGTNKAAMNFDYAFRPVTITSLLPGSYLTWTPLNSAGFVFNNQSNVIPVGKYPGYSGNGLSGLASMAQAHGCYATPLEMIPYPDFDEVGHLLNIADLTYTIDRGAPAANIEVIWYEGTYATNIEVIPPDADVITVASGETVVIDVPANAWLDRVNQPTCVSWVEADEHYYDGTTGVYAVAGNDNLPVTPSQWTASGGSLSVAAAPDDAKTLRVTVTGMTNEALSPFRIAMTSGNFYPALRVTADATRSIPHTLRLPTGVDPALTQTEVGFTVDNSFIQTLDQAYSVGSRLARKYSGFVMSVSGSASYVPDMFEYDDMVYFTRNVSGNETNAKSFDAELLTRMGDFEAVWAGKSMAEFEATWAGETMGMFMMGSLRTGVIDSDGFKWSTSLFTDNGGGTWTSTYPVDNGGGTWRL